MRTRRGEISHNHLLTDDHVLAIRQLAKLKFTGYEIGKFFGISYRTVYDILQKRTWAHVL